MGHKHRQGFFFLEIHLKVIHLTQHRDVHVSRLTAEGVRQWHHVLSCISSVWPEDHKTLFLHRVVRVGIYLCAVDKPHLMLHHSLQHAVTQGEPVSSFYGKLRWAQSHILYDFCEKKKVQRWISRGCYPGSSAKCTKMTLQCLIKMVNLE